MFRIKICGITSVQDALAAAEAGADAIGLNFCAQSPRCVPFASAQDIVRALPPHVCTVGVFVNEAVPTLVRWADELGLDYIQLHGDERPETIAELAPRLVIRALRLAGDDEPAVTYLRACQASGCPPAAVLVDALDPSRYGGTGRTVNWSLARGLQQRIGRLPLVLAGGLKPANIAEAIEQARPSAVDVASGVEVAPGRKDMAAMRQFVESARAAWQAAGP